MKVKCMICGKFFHNLSPHLRSKHKLTKDEYLRDFPDAKLTSDELRIKRTESISGDKNPMKNPEVAKKSGNTQSIVKKQKFMSGELVIWNKGLTKETDESVKKYADAKTGKNRPKEFRDKMSNVMKGKPSPKKGRTYEEMYGEEKACEIKHKDSINNAMHNLEVRIKNSESNKKNWQDPEFVKKMFKAFNVKPNKPEKQIESLLNLIMPNEYKINVKGEVMTLGGKIPDFVNVNGSKKVIEFNGCWNHDCPICHENGGRHKGVNGLKETKKRVKLFKKYGYGTLIIWEHDMTDMITVVNKIFKFHGLPKLKGSNVQTKLGR